MFFSSFILTKKGPLAKVWLAAHWEKRLTKSEVQLVDLNETIVVIRQPKVPISCRTQGELLLGCVRIYATKVSLLLKESSEPMSIPEPNEPGKRRPPIEDREVKEKRVTMAGGLENLVAIQEIASFDINEVFATSVHELPIAEGFNMEEWWGKSPEPLAMPGGMEPSKSPQSRNSVQQPVNLASEDEDPFRLAGNDVMLQMSEPVSGGDVSGGGIPTEQFPSPMTDPPLPVEKAVVPVPPPAAKPVSVAVFDPLTTLDQATLKKWTTNTTPITQDLALLPRTEEELELMKERRLTLDDMMFRAEPPLKRRRIDITGLASAHFIGMDDQSSPADERKSLFQEVFTKGLEKLQGGPRQFPTPQTSRGGGTEGGGVSEPFTPHPDMNLAIDPLMPEMPSPEPVRHHVENVHQVDDASANETLAALRTELKKKASAPFTKLAAPGKLSRGEAAAKFMDLLVLSSRGHVEVEQKDSYADITVRKGEFFNDNVAAEVY